MGGEPVKVLAQVAAAGAGKRMMDLRRLGELHGPVLVIMLVASAVGVLAEGASAGTPTSPTPLDLGAPVADVSSVAETSDGAAVYFVSPEGDDSNPGTEGSPWRTVQHAAELLLPGQTVYIRAGTYAERVRPRHSGMTGQYITYAAYPGESPVIDGGSLTLRGDQAALFEIRRRGYIRVTGLRIINAASRPNTNGILVYESHHIAVENNSTVNTRSSGIGVWGSRNVVVSGNEIVSACRGRWQESLTVAGTDTFEVKNNLVHDTGKEGIDAKDGSKHGKIHGNVVYNVQEVGIYIDAWDKTTFDIKVYGNVVHDVKNDGIAVASEMGGKLSNVRIYNNVVYNSGAVGITITRNGAEDRPHPMRDISIVNNTVWNNGRGWGGGISIDNPDALDVLVRNNIVSRNESFQLSRSPDVAKRNATIDHNLIHGYRGDLEDGEIYGANPVKGNPRFVNALSGNFHLRESSPAIDRGGARGAPRSDFDGRARPRGAGYDIGAYEYWRRHSAASRRPALEPRPPAASRVATVLDRIALTIVSCRGTTHTALSALPMMALCPVVTARA